MTETFYIGWDVGAWNCDKNPKSKDAIVFLGSDLKLLGKPFWGNLRIPINESKSAQDFIKRLLSLCEIIFTVENKKFILAIDAPLAFSNGLVELINGNASSSAIEEHPENPYLFRETERALFNRPPLKPLSAIKDMIGSQATKAIHVIVKFGLEPKKIGVWTDGNWLSVIETYPTALKNVVVKNPLPQDSDKDIQDALLCAELAVIFGTQKEKLNSPTSNISKSEGWIWTMKKNDL